jgi:hypothetical protein
LSTISEFCGRDERNRGGELRGLAARFSQFAEAFMLGAHIRQSGLLIPKLAHFIAKFVQFARILPVAFDVRCLIAQGFNLRVLPEEEVALGKPGMQSGSLQFLFGDRTFLGSDAPAQTTGDQKGCGHREKSRFHGSDM